MRIEIGGLKNQLKYDKPGTFQIRGQNGAGINIKSKMVEHTTTAAATNTITGLFEDGMLVLAVTARITVTIVASTHTTLALSDGSVDWFSKAALVAGTTFTQADAATAAAPKIYAATTDGTLTPSGGTGNFTAGGKIRIVVFYIDTTVPTS